MPRKMVPQLRPLQHFEVGIALQALDVLQRNRLHHVDLSGYQRGDTGGGVGDGQEDRFGDVGLGLPHQPGLTTSTVRNTGWRALSMNGPVPLAWVLA